MPGRLRVVAGGRVRDVDYRLVRRKCETVRLAEIGHHGGQVAALGIQPVDVAGRLLGRRLETFVVGKNAVGGVGEPYRVVQPHDNVVGRVQPPVAETIGENGQRPVEFRPGHAASPVLAGDEPTLAVAGIAVDEVGRRPEDGHTAALHPSQHPLVGNVAEDQALHVREPDGSLRPAAAPVELLQVRTSDRQPAEPLVMDFVDRRWLSHACCPLL